MLAAGEKCRSVNTVDRHSTFYTLNVWRAVTANLIAAIQITMFGVRYVGYTVHVPPSMYRFRLRAIPFEIRVCAKWHVGSTCQSNQKHMRRHISR